MSCSQPCPLKPGEIKIKSGKRIHIYMWVLVAWTTGSSLLILVMRDLLLFWGMLGCGIPTDTFCICIAIYFCFILFSTGLWLEAFSPLRNHLAIGRCWFLYLFDYSSSLCFNFTFGLPRLNLMPPYQVWNLQQICACRCLLQPAKPLSSNSYHFSKILAFFLLCWSS